MLAHRLCLLAVARVLAHRLTLTGGGDLGREATGKIVHQDGQLVEERERPCEALVVAAKIRVEAEPTP